MPIIDSAGTFTHTTAGYESLAATDATRTLLFGTGTLGSSCVVQYLDEEGTAHTFSNGTILSLPAELEVSTNINLQIVVTGSPDFPLTIA